MKQNSVPCKHVEEQAKDIVIYNGRTAIMEIMRCVKCGRITASPEQLSKARKTLKPSILQRLKEFFGATSSYAEAAIFKGKLL